MNTIRLQLRYQLPIWFVFLLTSFLPDNRVSIRIRGLLVGFFLKGRPRKLTIGRDVTLLNVNNLTLGSRVYIAKGAWLNCKGGIVIEDDVTIGPYCILASLNHKFYNGSYNNCSEAAPLTLEKGCWLAGHVSVNSGGRIPKHSVVAANSVMNKKFDVSGLYGGVPAKLIRETQL